MKSKAEFLSGKRASLSPHEKETAWKQYVASNSNGSRASKSANKASIRAGGLSAGSADPYLSTLLNPEGVRSVGVPDEFASPTFKFQSINTWVVPFQGSQFCIAARPRSRGALAYASSSPPDLQYDCLTASFTGDKFSVVNATDPTTQELLDRGVIDINLDSGRWARDTTFYMPSITPRTETGLTLPSIYLGPSRGYALGLNLPALLGVGPYYVHQACMFFQPLDVATLPATLTGVYEFFDSDGIYISSLFPVAVPVTLGALTHGVRTDFDFAAPPAAVPVNSIYVRFAGFKTVGAGVSPVVVSYSSAMKVASAFWTGSPQPSYYDQQRFGPCLNALYDVSGYAPTNSDYSRFLRIRPVSASLLVTYFGNMLSNGMLASKLVYTGEDPQLLPEALCEYSTLASTPQSFNGPNQKGTYCIWKPTNIQQATAWDQPNTNLRKWSDVPSIMVVGAVSEDNAKFFRARFVINFEAQTNSTIFGSSPTLYSPQSLHNAFAALAYVQPCMENETHLQEIRKILLATGVSLFNNFKGVAGRMIGNAIVPGAGGQIGGAIAAAIPNLSTNNGGITMSLNR